MTDVQEDIVKIKEDLPRTHQQVQLLQGLYGNLNNDVQDLTKKVDSCTSMLQQVLIKLKEPAPTPPPSFTENDRTSLIIAVEFIHQATSDIPVIEGRLERLEAEFRSLANAKEVAAEVQEEEPPSHVEGENVADIVPPSSILAQVLEEEEEEDEEDDEDLDLHDQEKEQQADDDDDDDEEDQSLWFSAANVSSATASKEVVTAGGRVSLKKASLSLKSVQSQRKLSVSEISSETVSRKYLREFLIRDPSSEL
ncbi:hypothetical protein L6452_19255 [Arctium lappa]|uniref:Uncharacterized protein n=1 Tax=Arctium lappa TaxID=4217 RepID=A0ACB9B825_ARCLA|nr:hypothetical protein L6452_19255 [Arctium lappa]